MSDQELKSFQEEDRICRSMVHLSTADDPHPAAVSPRITTASAALNHSTKRHSSLSPFQEPLHKRPALHLPSPPFKKLPLAVPILTRSPAPLRRTVSAPVSPPDANLTPPVGTGDSPSCKRLKKMKERLREISEWWDQLLSEEDNEEAQTQIHERLDDQTCSNGDDIALPETLNDGCVEYEEGTPPIEVQEAVWVDKIGEHLALYFKCPCGNGYEVLLSGNNCYYKLTYF